MTKAHEIQSRFHCEAYQKLSKLAEHPIDLTQKDLLNAERVAAFKAEGIGFKVLYATERVNEEVLLALKELATQRNAIDQMEQMQSGEIVNYIKGYPSEQRAALHTAVRDFFENPNPAKSAKEAAAVAKKEVEKLKIFLQQIDEEKLFKNLVVIGIGGSELGPKALFLALEYLKKEGRDVFFIGNIDPDNTAQILKDLDLDQTLVCVVSKSGTTLETRVNEEFVRDYYRKAKLDPGKHFIAVTGEGSPMDNPDHYLKSFYIWDWIGGRYSGSSIIGGVILGFAFGFEVYMEFLKGANAMDKAALNRNILQNLPLLIALLEIWNHNFLHIETLAIIPYSQALSRFPAHLQQLEMESNGKQIDRLGHFVDFSTGPIIWGEVGTNAQHSFYQLIHQGKIPIALEFIGFKECQMDQDFESMETSSQEKLLANLFAQAIALAKGQTSENPNQMFLGNRPSHIILGKKLTPFSLGALLALFEHKVAFEGFIWNINSFDQEGVQLGKVLAGRILDRILARKGKEKSAFPLADAYLNELDKL